MKIQQIDLTTQYFHIKEEIDEAVLQVIHSGQYINGKEVADFTDTLASYLESKYVIPCANGTDALQIALMALDFEPGDEVIVPAFNYIAAAEMIALLKLIPVAVDVDENTFNIDVEKLREAITNKTKAVIPVHLFGESCGMEPVMNICEEKNIAVIEDNAQSLGAVYSFSDGSKRKAGNIGNIGTFSFFPTKNLGGFGDGGAVCTNDKILADRLKMIASHGQEQRYFHDIIGCNSRLDSLQAAILNVKIKYLDVYIQSRQQAAGYYSKHLESLSGLIVLPKNSPFSTHTYNQYTIRVKEGKRDELKQFLSKNNIPSMIYYPIPLHKQKAYQNLILKKGDLSCSEKLCGEVLSLPMHTELNIVQQDYIIETIKCFYS